MAQQLSFATDIRPLFRDRDISSMEFAFDLASYEDVRTHAEALRLYTIENGWFLKEENQLGTIEVGKLGDLVALSDDYFDPAKVPDEAIKRLSSVLTVVGGKIVYDSGALGPASRQN